MNAFAAGAFLIIALVNTRDEHIVFAFFSWLLFVLNMLVWLA